MARMIATARIVMPATMVRLSAGRQSFSDAEQYLMFAAGANSIFNGDTLLTTSNPAFEEDEALFAKLGFAGKPAHAGPLVSPAEQHGDVTIKDSSVVTSWKPSIHGMEQFENDNAKEILM